MNDMPLRNKVAIVTGASRGIGRVIARTLASEGATLALLARSRDGLEQTTAELSDFAPAIMVKTCDISDPADVDDAVRAVANRWGRIDILVNDAGIQGPIGPFEEIAFHEWKRVIEVNLLGTVRLMQQVIPCMRSQGWGRIVNLSGGGATSKFPRFTAYAASKTAIVRLTETVAEELKGSGITVNAVAPGTVNTRMLQEVLEAGDRAGQDHLRKVERLVREGATPPERVASLVALLASDKASGVTGRLISAVWDNWELMLEHADQLSSSDVYTLRRIVPEDRGFNW